MADEIKDQRIITLMTPSEVEAIDEWMFKNRLKSRGEAIRRLCHLGMRSESVNADLIKLLMKGLDQEKETVALMSAPDQGDVTPMMIFERGQEFLREIYALVASRIMENMAFLTAPNAKEAIDVSKEIADGMKALGSSSKQLVAFLKFSEELAKSRSDEKADEGNTDP